VIASPRWVVRAVSTGTLALVLASGACTLALDTDGYVDDTRDGAFAIDASTDIAVQDVLIDGDAGEASRRCSADAHDFCADFDEGELTAGWGSFSGGGLGTFALDPDASTTEPRSLALEIDWTTDAPAVALGVSLDMQASAVVCELDVRITQVDDSRLDLFRLGLEAPTAGWSSWIAFNASSLETQAAFYEGFPDGGDRRGTAQASPFAVGEWQHVRVELSLSGTGFYRIRVEDVLAAQRPMVMPTPATRWTFSLGPGEVSGGPATWRLNYDSVICDHAP
jgi:hypothetical protein